MVVSSQSKIINPQDNKKGKIITFYSYKGGVGRTMILANVAWILASSGKKVLIIDWDLEAPGLHQYFRPFLSDKELTRDTEGLIDFFTEFLNIALTPPEDNTKNNDENWYNELVDQLVSSQYYVKQLKWPFKNKGKIDFIPAGRQDDSYAERVNSFNWNIFYERFGGGAFLEIIKERVCREYDYILIDSRTGVSDTAGICTVQMPDILVVLFAPNVQNILGLKSVINLAKKGWPNYRNSPQDELPIFPVLSRVELAELSRLKAAEEKIKEEFTPFLPKYLQGQKQSEEYWGKVEIPYYPFYSFEEILATFYDNPSKEISLLRAIERFVFYLTEKTEKKVIEFQAPSVEQRRKIVAQFLAFFSKKNQIFLSFRQEDIDAVKAIAERLRYDESELPTLFETWRLTPGKSRMQELEQTLQISPLCLFFMGENNQQSTDEIGFIKRQLELDEINVILVLLPKAPEKEKLIRPFSLEHEVRHEVRFEKLDDNEAISSLLDKIHELLPYNRKKRKPSERKNETLGLEKSLIPNQINTDKSRQVQGLMLFSAALADGLESTAGRGAEATCFRAGRLMGLKWPVKRKTSDIYLALESVAMELTMMGINWPFEFEKYPLRSFPGYQEIKLPFQNCIIRCALFRYGSPLGTALCQTRHGLFCGLFEKISGTKNYLDIFERGKKNAGACENACLLTLKISDD